MKTGFDKKAYDAELDALIGSINENARKRANQEGFVYAISRKYYSELRDALTSRSSIAGMPEVIAYLNQSAALMRPIVELALVEWGDVRF